MKIGSISVENGIFAKFHKKCVEFGTKISKGRKEIPSLKVEHLKTSFWVILFIQ